MHAFDVFRVKCEAMRFSVSTRGRVTVKTLCSFDKVVVPKDAFVEESAMVINLIFKSRCFYHSPYRFSTRLACQTPSSATYIDQSKPGCLVKLFAVPFSTRLYKIVHGETTGDVNPL